MAQALTVTVEGNPFLDGTGFAKVILDWTSASDGTVSLGICSSYLAQLPFSGLIKPAKIRGIFGSFETIPGTSGDRATALPTASYDVTLLDAYNYDVLGGNGANLSGTVAEFKTPSGDIHLDSELTLTIAAAGDTKKGRIILYVDPLDAYATT